VTVHFGPLELGLKFHIMSPKFLAGDLSHSISTSPTKVHCFLQKVGHMTLSSYICCWSRRNLWTLWKTTKRKLVAHGVCFTAWFMNVFRTFRWWMITVKKSKLVFLIVIYIHFSLFRDKILQYPKVMTTYITFKVYICLLYY